MTKGKRIKNMNKRDIKLISNLKNISQNQKLMNSIILIQNNINIYANSKIIALSSARDDISLCAVAHAMAEVYAIQNQSTLLIDCNMYNPLLNKMFHKENNVIGLDNIIDEKINTEKLINHISNNLDIVFANKTCYPTIVFKSKQYYDFIDNAKNEYDHIILVMPSLIEHQDILISKDLINAVLLIARKNKVSKKDLFDAINTVKTNNLPYVGVIYLK